MTDITPNGTPFVTPPVAQPGNPAAAPAATPSATPNATPDAMPAAQPKALGTQAQPPLPVTSAPSQAQQGASSNGDDLFTSIVGMTGAQPTAQQQAKNDSLARMEKQLPEWSLEPPAQYLS